MAISGCIDNLAVSPQDFDPFCITAPVDPRLPGGGGNQICGLYDIKPAKFGQVNNLVTAAKNYGKIRDVYDGVDVTVNARLPRGVVVQGGMSTGRELFDNCDVVGQVDNAAGRHQQASSPRICRAWRRRARGFAASRPCS